MNTTAKLRVVFALLLVTVTITAVVGWLLGKDPGALSPVIGWVTAAVAAGEASNVGKRATFNWEATREPTNVEN